MSLALSVISLTFGNDCAAAESAREEEKETIVVGANHAHSAEIDTVTLIGKVPDNGKKIGVTAKFSETEPKLDRLSILTPEGKTVLVPRSYYEKIRLPREESLSLGYIMAGDSNRVGGIIVFLDFGNLRRRADLNCANDTGDPVFESFTLSYDLQKRTFSGVFRDYCGEPISN